MNKFLHFVVLSFVVGLTFARHENNFFSWLFGSDRSPPHHLTPVDICSNTTPVQLYLTQSLVLITKLQANSTYNSILQLQSANYVAYLQNITNQAVLSTNCTIFVANLKAAQLADRRAVCARQQVASDIEKQFQQVRRNATGSNGSNELDIAQGRGDQC